jgi:coenzyme PQQ synthesis protein D (PqqD)
MKTFPKARREKVVVQELPDELLIYDLERDKAYCLNQTAALVWKGCDGRSTGAEIAHRIGKELQAPVDERVIWFALDQLGRNHLLENSVAGSASMQGMTRREMVRTLGLAAAVALPVVTSIIAPTSAQAASLTPPGSPCSSSAECTSGLCTGSPGICSP